MEGTANAKAMDSKSSGLEGPQKMLSGAGAPRPDSLMESSGFRELSHVMGWHQEVEESLGSVHRVTCTGVSGPFLSPSLCLATPWNV